MGKIILFLFVFFRLSFLFSCDLPDHFDFWVSSKNDEILYSGCYDAVHKGPHITEYILTKERLEAPSVKRPSAAFTQYRDGGILQALLAGHGFSLPGHSDYTNSGYDRGHMVPNADFNDTRENALMTFFIANIWPQTPEVNRVTWLETENKTRFLAREYLAVHVIIIVDEFSPLTVNDVQVPLNFKKYVYNAADDELLFEVIISQ
ncbi:MAG: DNA/RNA non-specific endonuclease [Treponema sp.]|jgi:DNA/RNA endonuclease G (NUC1)|nr:DNA/RNA non-specific endonuclease [Treponema sp.]